MRRWAITDVVRGDDHLSNTPKQLLVLEALGFEPPRYAHLPLLHGPDGRKLSKRHGAASVQELRDAGYLPAAVRNYLALLGWGADDDATLIPTEELVERFRVEDVGQGGGDLRREEAALGQRPLHARAAARRVRRRGGDAPRAASRTSACGPPARSCRRKPRPWTEVWPLIRFLFEPPVEDEKAWRKTMKDEAPAALEAAREALAAATASTPQRSRRRCRRCRSDSASSRAASTSRSGSRSAAAPSRLGSSSRWRCWGARNRCGASTRRSCAFAAQTQHLQKSGRPS